MMNMGLYIRKGSSSLFWAARYSSVLIASISSRLLHRDIARSYFILVIVYSGIILFNIICLQYIMFL